MALVVIYLRNGKEETVVYTKWPKQLQVLQDLFQEAIELKTTSDKLSRLHTKLESAIMNNKISDSNQEPWSHKNRVSQCYYLIEQFKWDNFDLQAWIDLANDCELDHELDNHVYYFATIDSSAPDESSIESSRGD